MFLDSIIDAVSYQEQKRVKSIPLKFRQPANTDAELNAENTKRKKKENIIKKAAKESAKVKNMAHLAGILVNGTAATIASQTSILSVNTGNIQSNDSENFPLDMPPKEVLGTGIKNQTFVSATSDIPQNCVQFNGTGIQKQLIVVPIDSTTTNISPNDEEVLGTGIQSQPIIIPFDLATAAVPPNDAEVTNNYEDIVRLAMDGLEGVDFLNIGDLDYSEGVDITFTEEYRSDTNDASTSDSVQNMTETIFIDVPLNACNLGNVNQIQGSAIVNLLSTPSTSALPEQQNNEKGETANVNFKCLILKICAFSENVSPMQERRIVGEIDYKKAYLQLQKKNESLDERNLALQNALVAANKASGKVPDVPFTKKVSRNKLGFRLTSIRRKCNIPFI